MHKEEVQRVVKAYSQKTFPEKVMTDEEKLRV